MEEGKELPGFLYDPLKRRYFKLNQELSRLHRMTAVKKSDQYVSSLSKKKTNISAAISNMQFDNISKFTVQESLSQSRLAQVSCIDSKKVELLNYRGVPFKKANCNYLIGEPKHDAVYGVWASRDLNAETGCIVQRFIFRNLPLNSTDREQVDLNYQVVTAFPPNSVVKDMSIIPKQDPPFSVFMCLTNHAKKDQTTCSSLGIYHLSNENDSRSIRQGEDINLNYEFWEPMFSCASHTINTIALGGIAHVRLFSPAPDSYISDHSLLQLPKPTNFSLRATSLRFSPDGKRLYAGSNNGVIFVYDVRQKKKVSSINLLSTTVAYLHALENEKQVIASCHENRLILVDTRNPSKGPVFDYPNHVNDCRRIPVSVDESVGIICCAGHDHQIRFWSLQTGVILNEWPVPTSEFLSPMMDEHSINHAWYSHSWNMLKGRPKPLVVTAIQDRLSVNYHLDPVE